MAKFFRHSEIPFTHDDAHRFLPWLVGVMACLVTLLLYLGLTANGWIVDRKSNYSAGFTVHVPAGSEAGVTDRIRDVLKQNPSVASIEQLSENKLKDSLKSWLGSTDNLDGLPLPTVLEAMLTPAAVGHFDYEALEKQLIALQPGVEVDSRERWVGAFSNLSATLQCLMLMLAALILAAMGAMVAFTARASLKLHSRTVHLLHAIGAEDEYIARQFQREAFFLVLPGAFCGSVAAGAIFWAVGRYMASLPGSLMPALSLTPTHLLVMILLPLICALGAWQVAHGSVTRQLHYTL